jgi:hypothetical protein
MVPISAIAEPPRASRLTRARQSAIFFIETISWFVVSLSGTGLSLSSRPLLLRRHHLLEKDIGPNVRMAY